MKLYDANGDECQMTGLPHVFYDKVAVNDELQKRSERITALESALKSCATVIHLELKERAKYLQTARDALAEADKVLSV